VLRPASDGGPVSLRWLAELEGPNFVTVQAVDRARRASAIATCHFRVRSEAPVADWSLADPAGSTAAADGRGQTPAPAGAGVTFGAPGPGGVADPAVRLTGAADSYLATDRRGVLDTQSGFSVSAWLYLTDNTRDAVGLSQSGSGEPGFTLGFEAASGRWKFAVPVSDFDTLGTWQVLGAPAVLNTWTHLIAVYDAQARRLSLYVDGGVAVTAERRSGWKARGAVQIGRVQTRSGYRDHWTGGLADVSVFNRMVVAREVVDLARRVPVRQGYWPLDTAADGRSAEYGGGQSLTFGGGAQLYRYDPVVDPIGAPALVGDGHLVLDGIDDHAATATAVADTAGSFTVTARVRLASLPAGRAMAVLSQTGNRASGFVVRLSAAGRWELALPSRDADGATVVTASDDQHLPITDAAGQHLALVYNAVTDEARLYVDGELALSAVVTHSSPWAAGGAFQVGRARVDGVWRDHLAGVVDEVRVYTGVVDTVTVQRLASLTAQPDL
jgi:hypothetical protein